MKPMFAVSGNYLVGLMPSVVCLPLCSQPAGAEAGRGKVCDQPGYIARAFVSFNGAER